MKSKAYINIKKWLAAPVRFLFRIHGHNVENEPDESEGPYVVISNHIANLDPVCICAVIDKQQPHFMAKKELFKVPVVGAFIKAIGSYPVDRKSSDITALRNTINLLKNKDCVGIFPQGTRVPGIDPASATVKNGIGLIAARSGADVLPVCVKTKGGKVKMFRKNYLVIGKLIKNEELDVENNKGSEGHQKIAEQIFDGVCELWATTDIENVK